MAQAQAPDDGGDDAAVEQRPICMEELVANNRGSVKRLPGCLHSFDESCILQWFCRATTCPCCRHGLATYIRRVYGVITPPASSSETAAAQPIRRRRAAPFNTRQRQMPAGVSYSPVGPLTPDLKVKESVKPTESSGRKNRPSV
ncbi:hypothetical protein ACQJBY_024945 [Aegilops geniculata]